MGSDFSGGDMDEKGGTLPQNIERHKHAEKSVIRLTINVGFGLGYGSMIPPQITVRLKHPTFVHSACSTPGKC